MVSNPFNGSNRFTNNKVPEGILKKFQEIRLKVKENKLSYKDQAQKLCEPQVDQDPSSSIVNQICRSYKICSGQQYVNEKLNPAEFDIIREDLKQWCNANGIKDMHSYMKRTLKIYFCYPKLHELAGRGFIDKHRIVEIWADKLSKEIPDNADDEAIRESIKSALKRDKEESRGQETSEKGGRRQQLQNADNNLYPIPYIFGKGNSYFDSFINPNIICSRLS